MRIVMCCVVVIGLSSGAFAQTAEAPSNPIKEKKVCKSLEKTGSILAARTCMTKSQWEAVTKKNAENLDRFARDRDAAASVTPRGPTGQ